MPKYRGLLRSRTILGNLLMGTGLVGAAQAGANLDPSLSALAVMLVNFGLRWITSTALGSK